MYPSSPPFNLLLKDDRESRLIPSRSGLEISQPLVGQGVLFSYLAHVMLNNKSVNEANIK